jgi:hypothetical protein
MAEEVVTTRESLMPSWAQPYSLRLLGQGESLAYDTPYVSYEGQRVAGLDPLQQQAYLGIGSLAPAQQLSQATRMARLAGMRSGMPQSFAPRMQQYMSPYIQGVLEQQKRGAIQDYQRSLPGLGAAEVRAGAYGGTRGALMRSEAQRNLQNQLQGIQATGLQQAYDQARQQYNVEQQARLQGLVQQLSAAGTLGQLGQQQFGQGLQALQQQAQMGEQARSLQQQQLEAQYQDFLARQQYPYKQLGFMSGLIGGVPSTSVSQVEPGGSNLGQLLGALGGIYSLYKGLGS